MIAATVVVSRDHSEPRFSGSGIDTLCDDVRARALEMSQGTIKGDIVGVAEHSAGGEGIKAAQLAVFDSALLQGCTGRSRAAQVIRGNAFTSLGATRCPESLPSL